MVKWAINYNGPLSGIIQVPGDKSISHRTVMLGALAEGSTIVKNILLSRDVTSTIDAFRKMGVTIEFSISNELLIQGVGLHGLSKPLDDINMGNSGTSMRLLSGILVGQHFNSVLIGDASLSKRPMDRIIKPLSAMGAKIYGDKEGYPPLHIQGNTTLHGMNIKLAVASAQVKSAVLLAGLYAQDKTTVIEPIATRDHTERLLTKFGCNIQNKKNSITILKKRALLGQAIRVPGDISSAAFWLVAGSIIKGSEILLTNVNINPTRIGVLNILQRMGANITQRNKKTISGEPAADLLVKSSVLNATTISKNEIPSCIDELPILFVAASVAKGITVISGAEELRLKETDRLSVMSTGLEKMGVNILEKPDGAVIQGGKWLFNAEIDAKNDHRCAMAFAVAASVCGGTSHINHCDYVDVSYPNFSEHLTVLGGKLVIGAKK